MYESFQKIFNVVNEHRLLSSTSTYTSVDFSSILTTLEINLGIFFILLILFEVKRQKKSVYGRRFKRLSHRVPPETPEGFMKWFIPVYSLPDKKTLEYIGLDAFVLLRFCRLCLHLCLLGTFFGLVVLVPIYATGGGDTKNNFYLITMANLKEGSNRMYASLFFAYLYAFYSLYILYNEYGLFIKLRSDFFAYGDVDVVPQTNYSIQVENIPSKWRSDVALEQYFNHIFPGQVFSAVVCVQTSELYTAAKKRQEVCEKLEKLVAWKEATGQEPYHIEYQESWTSIACCKGEKVESISFYQQQLDKFNAMISQMQQQIQTVRDEIENEAKNCINQDCSSLLENVNSPEPATFDSNKSAALLENDFLSKPIDNFKSHTTRDDHLNEESMVMPAQQVIQGVNVITSGVRMGAKGVATIFRLATIGEQRPSTGFVTFKNLTTKCQVFLTLMSNNSLSIKINSAPEPRDIIWANAASPYKQILFRTSTVNILLAFGAILWSIPVAWCAAVANIDKLKSILPFLKNLDSNSYLYDLINGYFPVLLLLGLMNLLPYIFSWIACYYEGLKCTSDVQRSVMTRYFYYQMANLYVSVTASSIFDALSDIMDNPKNIFSILGNSLPIVAGYFMQLIIVKLLSGLILDLARVWQLIQMWWIQYCSDPKKRTQRELSQGVLASPVMKYGWAYPNLILVLAICLIYNVISPIIMLPGALFFFLAGIVYKFQFLYTFIPNFESGGSFWFEVFNCTIISLILAQLTLIGYFLLKEGYTQAGLAVPLPIITSIFQCYCHYVFELPSKSLSLEQAAIIDQEFDLKQNKNLPIPSDSFSKKIYVQPWIHTETLVPNPYSELTFELIEKQFETDKESFAENYDFGGSIDVNLDKL